jgi:hypothetical protein
METSVGLVKQYCHLQLITSIYAPQFLRENYIFKVSSSTEANGGFVRVLSSYNNALLLQAR